MAELDVSLADGRVLHAYDLGDPSGRVVYWQHGSGMSGLPPAPLVARARAAGLRVVSHDRAGYGGSSASPGRSVSEAAEDALAVLDHLGVRTATTLGLSAGGMYALAVLARHPERFGAGAVLGCPAPYGVDGLDWWSGMSAANRAELEAALVGREELSSHLTSAELGPTMFAPADLEAMHGPYWDWQLEAAGAATGEGTVDDELACVRDWGFGPHDVTVPVLVLHGADDTFVPADHARWLAGAIATSTLRIEPGGHLSAIPRSEEALDWLRGS